MVVPRRRILVSSSLLKKMRIFFIYNNNTVIGENIITGKYIIKYIRVEEEEEGGSALRYQVPFVIYYGNKTPLLRRLLC